jgi:hypothetical protein
MKIKSSYIIAFILVVAAMASCKGKQPDIPGKETATSLWKMDEKFLPVKTVEVYSGDKLVETFDFEYDGFRKVTSIVRTDRVKNQVLFNLKYTYSGDYDMTVTGKYFNIGVDKANSATIDPSKRTVSYQGSWAGAWPFVTTYNQDGVVTGTRMDADFRSTGGYYSSKTAYTEEYTVSSGNVVKAVLGTEIDAQSQRKTKTASSSSLVIEYTYTNLPDNENFGVFLFNCEIPVWFAKMLPGNRNLVSGARMKVGDLELPGSFKMEYKLNVDGDIETATRTDYNGTEAVLVRTYKFTY